MIVPRHWLIEIRERWRYTHEMLSYRTGLDIDIIQRIESGKIETVRLFWAQRLGRALHFDWHLLCPISADHEENKKAPEYS